MTAADGRVFALKQVKLEGMKRVDREEAIDEVMGGMHGPGRNVTRGCGQGRGCMTMRTLGIGIPRSALNPAPYHRPGC